MENFHYTLDKVEIFHYTPRMEIEEIRKNLKARGWTYKTFAEKLKIAENTVSQFMRGKNKITDQLMSHIELLFSAPQNAVLVYKISLTDKQVEELTGGQQFPATPEGEARKAAAVEAVLLHNMQTLIDLGRKVDLPDDMKGLLLLFGETWEEKEDEKGGQP